MRTPKKKSQSEQTRFERFNKEKYRVKDPQAMKLRIIFNHLMWLVDTHMHPSPENKLKWAQAQDHFGAAEMQELQKRKRK